MPKRKAKAATLYKQIPNKMKIQGRTWRIRLRKGLERRTGDIGHCIRYSRTIDIDADLSQAEQEETLLHEILHAIFPDDIVGDRTEEKIVEALDGHLYAILVHNK